MLTADRRAFAEQLMFWTLIAAAVIALKQFYSTASAEQLQWMLRPLVLLLELLSDLSFEQLPAKEWVDATHRISIVKSCAGVNFFIISFLGYVWRQRAQRRRLRLVLQALAAAWLTALAANTLRILISVYGSDLLALGFGLSGAESHRLIGIVVYFVCLWAQLARFRPQEFCSAVVSAAVLYSAVTLLLPLLRIWVLGLESIGFEHVAWVAGIPLGAILACMVYRACRSGQSHAAERPDQGGGKNSRQMRAHSRRS